jgi:hypothetical protein
MLIWHSKRKVCKNLKYVSVKFAEVSICKSASLGPRNFGRKTKMNKACVENWNLAKKIEN